MASKKPIEIIVEEQADVVLEEVVMPEPVIVEAKDIVLPYVVAKDGDSYASLAAVHAPKGVRVHDFAQQLCEWNRCKPVRAGVHVKISK